MASSQKVISEIGYSLMNLETLSGRQYFCKRHAAAASVIGDGWVGDATDQFFCGRSVQQVTFETISTEYDGVWWAAHNFLSDEAYLFFLPALLAIALDDYEKPGADRLADALSFAFLRMAQGNHDDRLLPLLSNYSKVQLGVLSQFLMELSTNRYQPNGDPDHAKVAYDLFWHQYATTSS